MSRQIGVITEELQNERKMRLDIQVQLDTSTSEIGQLNLQLISLKNDLSDLSAAFSVSEKHSRLSVDTRGEESLLEAERRTISHHSVPSSHNNSTSTLQNRISVTHLHLTPIHN